MAKNCLLQSLCCVGLLAFASGASAEEAWQREILDIARTFSERAQNQDVMDYSLAHLHEQVLGAVANDMGLTNAEALEAMRVGYGSASDIIEMISHDIFPEYALFGEFRGWKWGAVPYGAQMVFRETGNGFPALCNWLLVFADDGRWFFNSAYTSGAATRGLPGPMAQIVDELEPPQCDL